MLPEVLSTMRMDNLLPRFRLIDWSQLRFNIHWIYKGAPVMPVREGVDKHTETSSSVWRLDKGTAWVGQDEASMQSIKAPCWIFHRHGGHGHRFSSDASILSINFKIMWPDGELLFIAPDTLTTPVGWNRELDRAAFRLLNWVEKRFGNTRLDLAFQVAGLQDYLVFQRLAGDWVAAYAEVMLALGCLPSRMRGVDERMMQILLNLYACDSGEMPLVTDLARQVGLSVSQINRRFVLAFGETPKQCMNRRRYERACQLLLSTREPIKQIAYGLGFKQPSHFAAWFRMRNQSHLYPAAFRDKLG